MLSRWEGFYLSRTKKTNLTIKITKVILAWVLFWGQIFTPTATHAFNIENNYEYDLDYEWYDDDFLDDEILDDWDLWGDWDDDFLDEWDDWDDDYLDDWYDYYDEELQDLTEDELNALFLDSLEWDEPIPAIDGYVPELLFAEDFLAYVFEDEIEEFIEPRNVPAVGSGLVQLVLEPVQSSLPNGVTMAQARAAAFNARTLYHPLFATANAGFTNQATSVNGRYGRDAMYLGQSANGNRFRILIAGFEGYVDRVGPRNSCGPQRNQACMITVPVNGVNQTFEVTRNAVFVPFNTYPNNSGSSSVRAMSHYVNRNGELWRYLINNVTLTESQNAGATTQTGFVRFLTGPAPSWMSQNVRYYSYDGVYFYRNPRNIRTNGTGAVNAGNPFFNYFQYLSFRSTSTVTATQLNNFLTTTSNHGINTSTSVMRNQGSAFITAQNRYGINALLMYAKAMHESAGGTSSIARNNNNLFGQGAIDAAPGTNAWHFDTPADSIKNLADGWLSRGYLWPEDWRYAGPHVGHKGSGMNVRYATDPYWGQKIAGWAFRIDRTRPVASRDLNREQIAIRQNTNLVTISNNTGGTLYTANRHNFRFFPFLVLSTATNNRLQIQTDPAIVNGVPNRTALYNRTNAVGFIPNSNVWLAGGSAPTPPRVEHQISGMVQTGVTRWNTAFRTGPAARYELIRTVNGSSNVRITGRTGIWYRVNIDGTVGFIRQSAVARTRQFAVITTNNAHLRTGRGTTFDSIARIPIGTRVNVSRRSANWSRISVDGQLGWVRNRDIELDTAMRPGRTITNNVTVHTRPRAVANIRATLSYNTQLMVVQRTTDGWTQVRIRHNDGTLHGWVRTNQIERRVHTRRLVRDGALRSRPDSSVARFRTIPTNSRVTIRSRVGNWYHVHVTINNRREYGWLHQNNLERLPRPR